MSKKIFFFDIDGTLAVKNIIPEDTKEALILAMLMELILIS